MLFFVQSLISLGGVIAIFSAVLILLALPILDFNRVRSSAFRPLFKLFFWLFVINFLILLFVGGQHVQEPFVTLGIFSTIFYFSYFIFILPLIGIIENTLTDLSLN